MDFSEYFLQGKKTKAACIMFDQKGQNSTSCAATVSYYKNQVFVEIKPPLKIFAALVKHPVGLPVRSDMVFLIKTRNVAYLRITNL